MSEEKAKKSGNRYLYLKKFEAYSKLTDSKLEDIVSKVERVKIWMKVFTIILILDAIYHILS